MMKQGRRAVTSLALLAGLLTACQQVRPQDDSNDAAPRSESTSHAEPASVSADSNHTWRAYPTGDRKTSTVMVERSAPKEVQAGSPYSYTLKVTNLTGLPLEDVSVKEILGDGFTFTSASPKPTKTGADLEWMLGTLPARQSRTITIQGSAKNTGSIKNCNEVDWAARLCTTTHVVNPALALNLSGPASVLSCEPITYKVVVSNKGTGAAHNVVVDCKMPDGMHTADGRTSMRVNIGDLAAGQSRQKSIAVKAEHDGTFSHVCTATADGGLKATSNKVSTVVSTPVLAIKKTGPERAFAGRTVHYTVTVTNTGKVDARDVVIQDILPSGAKFVSATGGGKASAGRVNWKLASLAAGKSVVLDVVVKAVSTGTLHNTATAQAYCAKPVSASVDTVVTGIPAILLEVVDLEDPIAVGSVLTYRITATNQGTAPGTNIKIVASLEDTMEFVSAGGDTTGSHSGRTVTFAPLKSLAPKESAVWTVKVKAVGEGDVRFAIEMTSDQLKRPVNETEATNFYK